MPLAAVSTNDALVIASGVLAGLAITSSAYFALTAFAAARFRARAGRLAPRPTPRPATSVLVPVAGREPRLLANLAAALDALGPGDELVVGAASAADPALDTLRELARQRPEAPLVVVAGSPSRATNRKVATLEALEARAKGAILAVVDSDVRLDRDLLERLTLPLEERDAGAKGRVGIATALYRGVPAAGLPARIEALAINADFVPSVLVADQLSGGIGFALGAANAVRREALEAIGGIASLGEVLADDHHLGKRIHEAGWGVRIAPAVVPIVQESSARDTFARLLRWARTVRVCQPLGYGATVVSHHGVTAALGALALDALAHGGARPWALGAAAGVVALRLATAAIAHACIAGRDADLGSLALLPIRDVVATALFFLAWTGRSVTWRGRRFRVQPDGTLRELSNQPTRTDFVPETVSGPLPAMLAGTGTGTGTGTGNGGS